MVLSFLFSDAAVHASTFNADLAAIFADDSATVSVVFGDEPTAQATNGVLTSQDVVEPDGLGGQVVVSRKVVIVRDGSLSGLGNDLSISVDGASYVIHNVLSGGRGRTRVFLA